MLYALTQGVLCDKDTSSLDKYFKPYLEHVMRGKHLQAKDFSHGISKIITHLPELVMDCPLIHQRVYAYIIRPLINAKILNYKFLRWDLKPTYEDEGDEDTLFEESDS